MRAILCSALFAIACQSSVLDLDASPDRDVHSPLPDVPRSDAPLPDSPDAGPPNVLPCDQLTHIGVWEQLVLPDEAGRGFPSIALDPQNAGVLFVGGVGADPTVSWGGPGKGLWRSDDCGASWTHVNTGRNADAIEGGALVYILIDPTDSTHMYTNSLYGGLGIYRSHNAGVDWDDIRPTGDGVPDFVQGEALDPSNAQHVVLTFHNNCGAGHAPMCLAETLDGGDTWRILDGPADATGWIEQAGLFIVGGSTWLLGAPSLGLYYTDNAGESWEQVLPSPGCFGFPSLIHNEGTYYLPCWGGLATSPNVHDWTLVPGSPHMMPLVLAGDTFFASFGNDSSGVPYWSASIHDLGNWSPLPIDHTFRYGGYMIAYDEVHHVVYLTSAADGMWRLVMQ